MTTIYVPSKGPEDWQPLLAKPDRHWKTGFSAKSLAYCWEEARGFPKSVQSAMAASDPKVFGDVEMLLAIPEHQVSLPPTDGRPTQCDLFVLARNGDGLITMAVEAKVDEPFGEIVSERFKNPTDGERVRLEFLCDLLELDAGRRNGCRYQLLHRTAATILEAKRFSARHAVMAVHSFSRTRKWLAGYQNFAACLGCASAPPGQFVHVGMRGGVHLHLGWVAGEEEFLGR